MNVAIVGAGKLGIKVAEALLEGDYGITIIDTDEEKLQRIGQQLDVMTINEDARDTNVLKNMKIEDYTFLLSTTDSDEANIIIASAAKKMGCKHVIARVRDPEHMNQFRFLKEHFSIDMLVNPDLAITNEIYKYLVEMYTLSNGIFTSGQISLLEFVAKDYPQLIGMNMTQVRSILPNIIVIAISKNGKITLPHGEDVIEENDFLYVSGEKSVIYELNKQVHHREKYTGLQTAMIIGGGKTGFYLAEKLSEFGISVKLIEQSKQRCQYLSTHLKNVMVLHGDGTDTSLLLDENVEDMDAFITATGYDEENLLLALTAKQYNVKNVISKVSRASYKNLIEHMGVDIVLNPLNITASNILHFMQGSTKLVSSHLIQGQAEIVEIIAITGMKITNIPLSKLQLPSGVLIAGIHRQGRAVIPDGDTIIKENDRVLMLSLLSDIGELEKLLKNKAGEKNK